MHSRSIGLVSVILIVACVLVWFTSSDPQSPVDSSAFLPQGAEDLGWPTIRGPHLTGHSDEIHLADAWPNHGPPVLWRRNLGQGYSSFVAFDGRVFTQYQTLAGQFVLCLDATTGSTLWQHRYDDPYELGGMYPGPRSTPTIDEKHIYFTSPDLTVGCLNWEGEELWSVDLSQRFESRGTGFGYACSPIIAGEKILLPVGGRNSAMIALNKRTGELIWKSGDDPASYSSALPVTVLEKQIVIGLLQNSLCGFDLHAGTQLFRVALSRGYDEHSAWPITRNDLVWISSPFQGGSQLYRIRPDQSPAIELIGEYESMSNDVASSVLVGEYVFGFDLKESQSNARHPSRGSFRCVNFYTGEVAWSNGNTKPRRSVEFETMKQSQTIGHASVIVADEKLILLNEFIFTWPGCLFLVFQHAMIVAQLRRNATHGSPWHGRATAAGFIAMCYVYFVICRDHNLVSAWIFLCAFPAAIPGALATRWIHNRQGMGNFAAETTAFLVSLTVYSVGAAAILWWRYGLPLN